jgi:hypothetical protein
LFKKSTERTLNTVLLFLLVFQLVFLAIGNTNPTPDAGYPARVEQVKAIIANTEKPVITENAWLVLSADKQLYIEPFVFTNLTYGGIWDDTEYINCLNSQRFDFIILSTPANSVFNDNSRFTKEQYKIISTNYHLIYAYGYSSDWFSFFVYKANRLG